MSESVVDCTQDVGLNLDLFSPLVELERRRVARQNRRARRKGLAAGLTLVGWLEVLQRFGWRCVYCQGPYESMEHLVGLADGGGTVVGNVVPCCVACNQARGRFEETRRRIVNSELLIVNCE